MKRNDTFTADDGTMFATAAECRTYERTTMVNKRLVGLTEEQVAAALSRTDVELANAIERSGNIIAAVRRASGELRRNRRAKAAPPMPVT